VSRIPTKILGVAKFSYCAIGRARGQNKMASGCMLLNMKSMCQNTCFKEKRPKLIQETSGTMFFKARSKIFFGISKKNFIHHKRYPQDDHSKKIFCKKSS
jgi:hypothetical protein